ncbi:hypothetical protein C8A00DRAFT_44082 [Chaetomidium leptoderma]|uniref:Altered inheritance of mitochondria protein 32 n=1 Tax=Chaetomidium leptoderma TaxID=669021 RepID=A0AAN6VKG3_9PEZI|nr:hypothetical protein C8A00DRAFT_44082 [Chaetomidium leptoderma]
MTIRLLARACARSIFIVPRRAFTTKGPTPFPTTPTCPAPSCPCAPTPEFPPGFEIDHKAPLNGLISNYAQHVLVCTGRDDWPSRIEEDNEGDNLAARLRELSGPRGKYSDPFHNISILNSSFPSSSPPPPPANQPPNSQTTVDSVYILPQFKYVPLLPRAPSDDSLEALVRGYLQPETLHPMHDGASDADRARLRRDPGYQTVLRGVRDVREVVVLVCGHGGRDQRCGVFGPLLRGEFERRLPERGVEVLKGAVEVESFETAAPVGVGSEYAARVGLISHIGGHKFAGNVILYLPPGLRTEDGLAHPLAGHGIWYGRVEPRHVEGIVGETILKGRVIEELPQHRAFHTTPSHSRKPPPFRIVKPPTPPPPPTQPKTTNPPTNPPTNQQQQPPQNPETNPRQEQQQYHRQQQSPRQTQPPKPTKKRKHKIPWFEFSLLLAAVLIFPPTLTALHPNPLNPTTFSPFTITAREQSATASSSKEGEDIARAWEHGLWSVEVKQPELQVARDYTPLPPPPPPPPGLLRRPPSPPGDGGKDEGEGEEGGKRGWDDGKLRFYVRKMEGGEVSSYLSRLKVGDTLELRGPRLGALLDMPEVEMEVVWANRRREDCDSRGKQGAVAALLEGFRKEYGDRFRYSCTVDEEGSFIDAGTIARATGASTPTPPAPGQQSSWGAWPVGGAGQKSSAVSSPPPDTSTTSGTCRYHAPKRLASSDDRDVPGSAVSERCQCKDINGNPVRGGKNLLMVSGPDGFIAHFAGPKVWGAGKELQGPVKGVVGDLKRKYPTLGEDWLVLKM